MKRLVLMRPRRGFTLIELMVVVAVVAVVLMMAAPAFRDMIIKQRLQGTADQFMTDVQFARTEAASRQTATRLRFKTVPGMTCYIIHTCNVASASVCTCDCSAAAGSRCNPGDEEIRTVQLSTAQGVALFPVKYNGNTPTEANLAFDPATGGVTFWYPTSLTIFDPPPDGDLWVKVSRAGATPSASIRTVVNATGRPRACAQGGSVSGMNPC